MNSKINLTQKTTEKYIKKNNTICTTKVHQMYNYYAKSQSLHSETFLLLQIAYLHSCQDVTVDTSQ